MNANAFFTAPDCTRPLNVVGKHITVLASGEATGSYEVFLQEGPAGSGPIPHSHPWDESFYVIRGEVDFTIDGGEQRTARPGALVHVPAGVPHWFRWGHGGGALPLDHVAPWRIAAVRGHRSRDRSRQARCRPAHHHWPEPRPDRRCLSRVRGGAAVSSTLRVGWRSPRSSGASTDAGPADSRNNPARRRWRGSFADPVRPHACDGSIKVLLSGMAKEKVTLTLDAGNLASLRALGGPRSLSATVDHAIAAHVTRMKHLAAVDEWLEELESQHGPVPSETLEWAGQLVDEWAKRSRRRRAG